MAMVEFYDRFSIALHSNTTCCIYHWVYAVLTQGGLSNRKALPQIVVAVWSPICAFPLTRIPPAYWDVWICPWTSSFDLGCRSSSPRWFWDLFGHVVPRWSGISSDMTKHSGKKSHLGQKCSRNKSVPVQRRVVLYNCATFNQWKQKVLLEVWNTLHKLLK